jgi:hypothetical protein
MIFSGIYDIDHSRIGDLLEDNASFCKIGMNEAMASEIIFHPFLRNFSHISR